jgi:hypothetical protein
MKDSPRCLQECGAGKVPIRVWRGSVSWWGACEIHVMRHESGCISQGDAPLIAAAPDMLAALKLIIDADDQKSLALIVAAMPDARAAIARAEGR